MKTRILFGLMIPVSISACELFRDLDFPCELKSNCPIPEDASVDASLEDSGETITDARTAEDRTAESSDTRADVNDDAKREASPANDAPYEGEAASDSSGERCDSAKSPDTDPCTIDEAYAVFVAPSAIGTTTDGSRAHPLTSLTEALQRANADQKRVYVCDDGTGYKGPLSVGPVASAVKMFGGFECSGWTYDAARRARLTADTSPVLTISNLSAGLLLQDFEIVAQDAPTPGQSSIGIVVNESVGVELRRVKVTAGKGRAGTDGENGGGLSNNAAQVGTKGIDGANACSAKPNPGGSPVDTMCNGVGSGTSGRGGDGALNATAAGGDGTPISTSSGQGGTGEPVSGPWSCDKGGGHNGDNGTDGPTGASGAGLGSLTVSGWKGNHGANGSPGQPGQGGGGGAGAKAPSACTAPDGGALSPTGASGGGGGSGGCGGNGGMGGMAGGSSIALVSISSGLTLESCELTANDAGKGGNGGQGQSGGIGGLPGIGGVGAGNPQSNPACAGGQGGKGGNGGAGGGGQGGHSIGIAYQGTLPVGLTQATVQIGAKGAGGQPGTGTTGKGADGKADKWLAFNISDAGN